jgi:hypothetical protein
MASHNLFFTVSPYSAADLTERVAREIADHLAALRHPDGVAPIVLAEHLVTTLRESRALWTSEDLEQLGDET